MKLPRVFGPPIDPTAGSMPQDDDDDGESVNLMVVAKHNFRGSFGTPIDLAGFMQDPDRVTGGFKQDDDDQEEEEEEDDDGEAVHLMLSFGPTDTDQHTSYQPRSRGTT